MKLVVVVPTYNEKGNVENLINSLEAVFLKISGWDKNILIVDDNSPDGTSKIVMDYIKKSNKKNIQVLTRIRNHGLTNSLKDGLKLVKGDAVVWLDCDFSMPPRVINKLLKKAKIMKL